MLENLLRRLSETSRLRASFQINQNPQTRVLTRIRFIIIIKKDNVIFHLRDNPINRQKLGHRIIAVGRQMLTNLYFRRENRLRSFVNR